MESLIKLSIETFHYPYASFETFAVCNSQLLVNEYYLQILSHDMKLKFT